MPVFRRRKIETLKLIPKEEKMKRFWLVMLSLGLVLAFSASAMAVDVKFSGSFYAAGMYLDKTTLKDTNGSTGDNVSTAFYYQRLRVGTDFIVSPGLKLVTRFDAMERAWGAARTTSSSTDLDSAGTALENENIAFDVAYVQWQSPIGYFMVGYQPDGAWGTKFGDSDLIAPKVQFATQLGPVILAGYTSKSTEKSLTAKNTSTNTTDVDSDKYILTATYNVNKDISMGMLYGFYNLKQYKASAAALSAYGPFTTGAVVAKAHILSPYAKAKVGPVSLEAELLYAFGTAKYEDAPAVNKGDITIGMLNVYAGATVDLGMVYFGANLAYLSGDDYSTTDKWEGGQIGAGWDWNPCLIMFNRDRTQWAGSLSGWGAALPLGYANQIDSRDGLFGPSGMTNAWFGQGVIGVRPIAALDIKASLAYAAADKKPVDVAAAGGTGLSYLNSAYGWELDVTGTYKITNNLSYMLGVGYLFTGDYFKGSDNNNTLRNDYLLVNKLTLTF
jgi:hypothetical protein